MVGGDDHLPALAPKDSASVQIKVPTSGPPARVSQPRSAYSVKEGDVLNARADRHHRRRRGGAEGVFHRGDIHRSGHGHDQCRLRSHLPERRISSERLDRHRRRGVHADAAGQYPDPDALDDDEHEADETFTIVLQDTPGVSQAITINYTPVTVTITDDDALDVTGCVGDLDAGGSERVLPGGGDHQLHGCHQRRGDGHGHAAVHLRAGRPEAHQAAYTSGSDTKELVFTYTVLSGDDDHDGISWSANALGLNGGAIKFMHADPAQQDRRPSWGTPGTGSPGGPQGGRDEADPGVGQAEPDHDDADLQRGAEPHRSGSLGLHGKGQRRRRRRPNGGVRERPRRDPHAGDGGAPRSNGDGELRAAGHEQSPGPERKAGLCT